MCWLGGLGRWLQARDAELNAALAGGGVDLADAFGQVELCMGGMGHMMLHTASVQREGTVPPGCFGRTARLRGALEFLVSSVGGVCTAPTPGRQWSTSAPGTTRRPPTTLGMSQLDCACDQGTSE